MIDTHAHLNFKAFEDDWMDVIRRAFDEGVEKIIIVGTDLDSSKKAVQMTKEMDNVYASVGIHPHHTKQFGEQDMEYLIDEQIKDLKRLIKGGKVVAIGEIGIDYHVYSGSKKYNDVSISEKQKLVQKDLFIRQVELALENNLPVIVHSREAGDEVLVLLNEVDAGLGNVKGVFHCFEGSKKYVRKILDAGYYVSFTGNITFDEGRAITSKEVPLDRLLLETDSPYMTPQPLRERKALDGSRWRNEPINVKIIASYHADLRSLPVEKVVLQTTKNAEQLFGI